MPEFGDVFFANSPKALVCWPVVVQNGLSVNSIFSLIMLIPYGGIIFSFFFVPKEDKSFKKSESLVAENEFHDLHFLVEAPLASFLLDELIKACPSFLNLFCSNNSA